MRKQLFLSLAVIVLCITIPIGCDSGSSNKASDSGAAQTSQEADNLNKPDKILFNAKLTGDGVNLRTNADTTSKVICQLYKDYEVGVIIDDANGWSKINYKDTTGFVPSKYLERLQQTDAGKDNADANGKEGADADKTEEKSGADADSSTGTTQTDVKDGAEAGAEQAEATDKDTTGIADAEKGDTIQEEPTPPADTPDHFTVNPELVDSLWKQMLLDVYVADDTTLAKVKQSKEDSLNTVVAEKQIDALVLNQLVTKEVSTTEQEDKGMPYWLAWVIGGSALLLGILPTFFIMRKRKKSSDEDGGGYFNAGSPTPQEVKALRKRADELDKDVIKLRKEVETAKRSYDEAKRKLDNAEREKQDAVDKAVKLCREEKDIVISGLQKEVKLYSERAVFFLPAQNFAQRATAFFDVLDQLQADVSRFKTDMPSGVNADDYNYYLVRIERKFYTSTSKLENLPQWRRELQMLAKTGLIPTGGLIDKRMGAGKVKEQEMESTLRMLLYQAVMSSLAGAAVVMSDEMAIMLPQMVAGVKGAEVFVKTTEQLKKAIADMGYDLNYVKPFTQLNTYKDVQNVQFTKAEVPEGTIFEVMKMALNFGSTKSNTEVSAK